MTDSCIARNCDRPSRTKKPGYCSAHQNRIRRHGDPQEDIPVKSYSETGVCYAPDCSKTVQARGLCATHDWRLTHWGTFSTEGRRLIFRAEIGARRIDNDGYIKLKLPDHVEAHNDGWAYEHRVVISDHLGRKLTKTENVHHINGDRHDNRLENLELWNTAQPAGQRPEDKVKYALEMLSLYRPDLLA